MYDVIVVGARVAGAPTAMLLARKGYRVLLIDRATFPSDTLSTHQIQLRGVAPLKRWGLLDEIINTNCPPIHLAAFNTGEHTLRGSYPALDGVDAILCPRRTLLDKILVDAAVRSGAELRQDYLVEGLTVEAGKVTGIQGHSKAGETTSSTTMKETARLVIGADGKHSLVAREMQAREYNTKPVQSCAYYSYWEGVELERGEMYLLDQCVVGIWPTNDHLTLIYTAYPIEQFQQLRKNIQGSFWKTIDQLPDMSERIHQGQLTERFYGTADLPGFYRQSHGPGWALVGDSGLTMDPVTGQGIGNAFRDAERMAEAVDAVFSGRETDETAFATYERLRNEETWPMYAFTAQIAEFLAPPIEQKMLFAAMANQPQAINQYLGALTGSVPLLEFFSTRSLFKIIGIRGMGRILISNLLSGRKPTTIPGKPT